MKKCNQVLAVFAASAMLLGIGSIMPSGSFHSLISTQVSAAVGDSVTLDEITYEASSATEVTIKSANKVTGDIIVPSTVAIGDNDYTVTSVADGAFYGAAGLTSISMPSVTTLGDGAFSGCSKLTSVKLPKVTSIGNSAFAGCVNLTSIDISSVTSLGQAAFAGCAQLTSLDMPDVNSIGAAAFNSCSNLNEVKMPKVTSIGTSAFAASKLTSIDITTEVTIGTSAFASCTSLTNVNLPNATISGGAFAGCTALTSANLSNATIESKAFDGCTGLKLAYVPLGCDYSFEAGVARYVVSDKDDYIKITDINTTNNTFAVVVNTNHFGGSVADGADYFEGVDIIVDGNTDVVTQLNDYVESDDENNDYITYYVSFSGTRTNDHTVMAQVTAYKWEDGEVNTNVPYYYVTPLSTIEKS